MMSTRFSIAALLAVLIGGCGEDEAKEPIKIGLLTPKTGPLQSIGEAFERVGNVAVQEINRNGGVGGHQLELVVKDTEFNPEVAAMRLNDLIDDGVVAVVGPALSSSVAACVDIARVRKTPIISPSSTAPSLITADDDGFMFRNVSNDNIQGVAVALYLADVADPPVTEVHALVEDSAYGMGLLEALEQGLAGKGGTVAGSVLYPGEAIVDVASAQPYVDQLLAMEPSTVVLVALGAAGVHLINAWDSSGQVPNLSWFLTDGARTTDLTENMPAKLVGTFGTAPTNPIRGDAYDEFIKAYKDYYEEPIGQQVFSSNVWDGVYLIATALLQQSARNPEQAFGGDGLRDALYEISTGPGVILHAGQWRDISGAIRSGGTIDFDGAAGPSDFDACGESVSPYEVWKIIDTSAGGSTMYSFKQELFLEAREISASGGTCTSPN